MKKISTILLALTLVTAPLTTNAEKIYENITQEQITKGVLYERTNTYTTDGWQRIDVVKIDLTDKDLEIKVLTPEDGSSSLATVKQLAESYHTKAAVNGDFFNLSSGETNMLGMAISDGEIISTPAKDNLASFALTDDNSPIFDYFTFSGTLYAENTSLVELSSVELYQINKTPITTGAVSMFTPAWGKTVTIPLGNYAMIAEPYEENIYKMVGFSWGGEALTIPDGGAVFTANYEINGFLNLNFAMGDLIRVETSLTPDATAIKESIGGNTLLVKDGKLFDFTNDIKGKNPRTALGVSASGDTLFFVTVDGRKSDCAGFTQADLASFMLELGCENAINLDGGGSTTMVTENRFMGTQEVKNDISSLRRVSNAIGVVSHLAPLSTVTGGEIALSSDTVVCDDSIDAYYVFYDKNFNNVPVENPLISTTDNDAVISGNKITFKTPGDHFVYVSYGDVTLISKIKVLGDIFAINIYPESASVTEGNQAFTVTAYDKSGYSAPLPSSLVDFECSDNLSISGNVVKKSNAVGTVTARYKNLTSNAVLNGEKYIREDDIKANDIFYGTIKGGKQITVTGTTSTPETLLEILHIQRYLDDLSGNPDIYATTPLYDIREVIENYQSADTFSERTIENSKIITVSAQKSSSIRLTDSSAWLKIKSICNKATEKNFVFVLDIPIYNLNSNERIVWDYYMNILTEKGKNVFVVSPGVKSEVTTADGVRYLYVGGVGNCSLDSFFYDLEQSKPLRFTFLANEIKYSFE